MERTIKCLLLKTDKVLITEIIEVGSELGEPDCKLINPFKLNEVDGEFYLEPWLTFTTQNEYMMHSDSILTIVDPSPTLLEKYQDLIK